jgi:trigger factor
LNIESEILDDHQIKLTVEIEEETMEGMKRRAARKIARRVKIPGFRPGKAPYHVIARQVGEAAVLEEALELLVDDIYPKVIEEADVKPYGPGTLENVESMDPPVLEFIVPLDPEVDLGDYRSLRKVYEPVEISADDVDDVLENLRERQAIIEPVERQAQEGDVVTLKITAKRKEEKEEDDNDVPEKELVEERTIPIIIQSYNDSPETEEEDGKEPHEWPYVGFSEVLIGLSTNDERTVEHSYTEDEETPGLQGENAVFSFVVEDVKSRKLPDFDDEFASSIGNYSDMEELRKDIETTLERKASESYNESYDEEILDQAVEQASFKYPPQALEREIQNTINNLKSRLEQQNLDLDLYLKTRDMDMDALKEEVIPAAETRLKRSLFLFELANVENIEVKQEEVQSEAMQTMNILAQSLPKKEARKLSDKKVYNNLIGNVMVDMIERRSMEFLQDIFSGKMEESQKSSEDSEQNGEPTVEDHPDSEIEGTPETNHETEIIEEILVDDVVDIKTEVVVNDSNNELPDSQEETVPAEDPFSEKNDNLQK